jgi:hypothetical protein
MLTMCCHVRIPKKWCDRPNNWVTRQPCIKGEAEKQADSEKQRRLLAAAAKLADATTEMVEATRFASSPQNEENEDLEERGKLKFETHTLQGIHSFLSQPY